jgi:predicted RNA-binding Zn-ribbon protein involved in translation (DUF1610 family)
MLTEAQMAKRQTKRTSKRKPAKQVEVVLGPTEHAYPALQAAYDFFNKRFFGGRLPGCLITMQRRRGANGYFAFERFQGGDGKLWDEIAMNPMHFRNRSHNLVLSTLNHEMAHQWQHHEGHPSRRLYHNQQWGDRMEAMGLMPSTTGQPGGRRTGQRVTHYIIPGGPFERALAELPFDPDALYQDVVGEKEGKPRKNKTTYNCPDCGLTAWAKAAVRFACVECGYREMIAEGEAK